MTPNLSILIPSRARPDGLLKTIRSLFSLARNPALVEAVVRLDYDDSDSILRLDEILKMNVKVIIGDRYRGYIDLHRLTNECAAIASGKLLMAFNDDAWIETRHWDMLLSIFPYSAEHVFYASVDRPIDRESEDYKNFAMRARLDFPIITRPLYEKIGVYSPTPAYDWFWNDAVTRYQRLGGEVLKNVLIQHSYVRASDKKACQDLDDIKVEVHRTLKVYQSIEDCYVKIGR